MSTPARFRATAAALAATMLASAMAVAGLTSVPAAAQTTRGPVTANEATPLRATGAGLYLVTLVDPPTASYAGGIDGYARTRPAPGERFDRNRPAVVSYAQRLATRQNALLREIGDPDVLYRFTTAVNGFVAELTADQVKQLRATPGVLLVERSTTQRLASVDSPDFLRLDEAWRSTGGPAAAGRGLVVGVIDSGIWPENPSLAGLPQQAPGRVPQLDGFRGACQPGEQWDRRDCTSKVVSARWYVAGFGADNVSQSEYLSPRDATGHGSHVAATTAGNDGVKVRIEGQDFGSSTGMAPSARVAVYKACWAAPNPADDGCTTADSVAAIDQAVADGVDVLSYAIESGSHAPADSVGLAFLHASAAGVFVAAAAGNGGPGAATVSHPAPWVTTVGASTHRLLQGSVVLGDGTTLVGAMVSDQEVRRTGIVLAARAVADGATLEQARRCEIDALDSDVVQDKIVVCDRGTNARVEKSAAVARAGGVGMVLANVTPGSQDADFHDVPTVHLDAAAADTLRAYLNRADDPEAGIDPDGADAAEVPQIAGFSARGPVAVADGDLLKPDLTAPGVGVAAAVAPASSDGRLWDLASGTSTSAAHVAGLAAFIKSERPTWSPARIKSAMMTTAYPLAGEAGPFAEGAGHVDPTAFLDPGLALDVEPRDYLAFLSGQGLQAADGSPVARRRLSGTALNLPSIAVGDLVGRTRVRRTVTNVSSTTESYTARVTGLDGIDAVVRPSVVRLAPGESATLTVVLSAATTAQPDTFTRGRLVLTGSRHRATLPMVVRAQSLEVPDEVTGSGGTGDLEVEGAAGAFSEVGPTAVGLAPAQPTGISLVPGSFDPDDPQADADTEVFPVTVPAGTALARFELESHRSGDDMDVFVYRDNTLVAVASGPGGDETVTLVEPEAGQYAVYVASQSAGNTATTTGQFYSWVIQDQAADNLQVAPDTSVVGAGDDFRVRLSWRDLPMTSRWFGAVEYGDTGRRTLVSIR